MCPVDGADSWRQEQRRQAIDKGKAALSTQRSQVEPCAFAHLLPPEVVVSRPAHQHHLGRTSPTVFTTTIRAAVFSQGIVEEAGEQPVGRAIERAGEQQERVVFGRAHDGLEQRWNAGRG